MSSRFSCSLAIVLLVACMLAFPAVESKADPLSHPQGPVILTITGKIRHTNAGGGARFDLAMLQNLGRHDVRTTTPWTDGKQTFSGVLIRDLLHAVGAWGDTVKAIAINDYSYRIEIADFNLYPVILASQMNGELLRIREKGPLWIIYPRDDFAELQEKAVEPRMVWQVRELVIE